MFYGHFDFSHPFVWTLPSVWAPEECGALIARAEARGEWLPATVNAFEGRVVNERVRNNDIALVEEEGLAERVFAAIRDRVPASFNGSTLVGLKDSLRIYRYRTGEHFGLHHDQSYFGPKGEKSELTFMLYLNHDFEGGETDFPELGQTIVPATGMVLLFQHMVLHEGRAVTQGTKYVLRTDVLYRA